MVDTNLNSSMERMSLSSSEHGHISYASRHPSYRSSGGLNGSNHVNRNNSFGGPPQRRNSSTGNKSFTKPKLSSSNSSYDPLGGNSNHSIRSASSFQHSYKKPLMPAKHQYLAMDCEMVGTVTGESVAARVVLIDWKGRAVLDTYMKPNEAVADYRTFVSGITEEHLTDAPAFADAVQQVQEMLLDKILVGHGVDNDLRALGITHPWLMTRDTAYYQPFMRLLETSTLHNQAMSQNGSAAPVWGPRKLKDLAKEKLQREIQVAGVSHCPVEDAAAALDLYKSHRPRWEACMSTEEKQQQQHGLQMAAAQFAYEASIWTSSYTGSATPSVLSSSYTGSSCATSSTRSSLSTEDLNMSVHSYFHYNGTSSRFQSGLDGSSHHYDATNALHTGYQPHQQSLDARSYHGNSNSLDARTYHGPISRPYNRTGSVSDYCSNYQQRPTLQRQSSTGNESSHHQNYSSGDYASSTDNNNTDVN